MELKKEVLDDGMLSICVIGRIDASTAPQLEREVVSALSSSYARCVLDLTEVEYMSSAGLRVLMLGAKTAGGVKGVFAICSIQESVRNVLAMVGFLPLLDIHENKGIAV